MFFNGSCWLLGGPPHTGATRNLNRGSAACASRGESPSPHILNPCTPTTGHGARPSQEGHRTYVPGSWVTRPAPPGNTQSLRGHSPRPNCRKHPERRLWPADAHWTLTHPSRVHPNSQALRNTADQGRRGPARRPQGRQLARPQAPRTQRLRSGWEA